jgi:hypothetical protein
MEQLNMARAMSASKRWEAAGQALEFDGLRASWFAVHVAIILFAGTGWLIAWRPVLFVYLLLLPLIVLQWLLNGGASIINNFENLARTGRWNDQNNPFEGAFFSTLLKAVGIHVNEAQVTTLLCFVMLIFWVAALCRLMLIEVPAPL